MKKINCLLLCLIFALGVSAFPSGAVAQTSMGEPEIQRLAGPNRYATAAAVSNWEFPSSEYVILARGDDFADALAGVPLAFKLGAPVLLTQSNQLTPESKTEIIRLGASKAILLGGEGVIHPAVAVELAGMGLGIERLSGSNRYATAAEIARRLVGDGEPPQAALIAYGLNFPDALAAAGFAARKGYPILLTQTNSLPEATAQVISDLAILQTIVAGGTGVVSDQVMDLLPGPQRVAGADRFITAQALAEFFQPQGNKIFVATGSNFADAVAGAVAAARHDAALLLSAPQNVNAAREFIKPRNIHIFVILGGEGAVSEPLVNMLWDMTGINIRITQATYMAATPGGDARRYPYEGYVTQALEDTGSHLKIRYGSEEGWIAREKAAFTDSEPDYPRLAWQFTSANQIYLSEQPNISGFNVYSPVNLYVNKQGEFTKGEAFTPTLELARQQGYQVWVTVQQLISNPSVTDPVLTESLADQILVCALELDADGINIDFEGMGKSNKDKFTQFMTYMYQITRPHNLILSVDVTRVASASIYSECYDRRALAQVSDYIILMAYDQHWSSCPVPGSVADLPWTEASILQLIGNPDGAEYVPPEKLILAMPFYARNWRTGFTPEEDRVLIMDKVNIRSGPGTNYLLLHTGSIRDNWRFVEEVQGQAITNSQGFTTDIWYRIIFPEQEEAYISAAWATLVPAGTTFARLTSSAFGLQTGQKILDNFSSDTRTSLFGSQNLPMFRVTMEWDSYTQQTKITWLDGQGWSNIIWLEDYHSLSLRRKLMDEYNLAGLAAWSVEWMDAEGQAWNQLMTEVPQPVYEQPEPK